MDSQPEKVKTASGYQQLTERPRAESFEPGAREATSNGMTRKIFSSVQTPGDPILSGQQHMQGVKGSAPLSSDAQTNVPGSISHNKHKANSTSNQKLSSPAGKLHSGRASKIVQQISPDQRKKIFQFAAHDMMQKQSQDCMSAGRTSNPKDCGILATETPILTSPRPTNGGLHKKANGSSLKDIFSPMAIVENERYNDFTAYVATLDSKQPLSKEQVKTPLNNFAMAAATVAAGHETQPAQQSTAVSPLVKINLPNKIEKRPSAVSSGRASSMAHAGTGQAKQESLAANAQANDLARQIHSKSVSVARAQQQVAVGARNRLQSLNHDRASLPEPLSNPRVILDSQQRTFKAISQTTGQAASMSEARQSIAEGTSARKKSATDQQSSYKDDDISDEGNLPELTQSAALKESVDKRNANLLSRVANQRQADGIAVTESASIPNPFSSFKKPGDTPNDANGGRGTTIDAFSKGGVSSTGVKRHEQALRLPGAPEDDSNSYQLRQTSNQKVLEISLQTPQLGNRQVASRLKASDSPTAPFPREAELLETDLLVQSPPAREGGAAALAKAELRAKSKTEYRADEIRTSSNKRAPARDEQKLKINETSLNDEDYELQIEEQLKGIVTDGLSVTPSPEKPEFATVTKQGSMPGLMGDQTKSGSVTDMPKVMVNEFSLSSGVKLPIHLARVQSSPTNIDSVINQRTYGESPNVIAASFGNLRDNYSSQQSLPPYVPTVKDEESKKFRLNPSSTADLLKFDLGTPQGSGLTGKNNAGSLLHQNFSQPVFQGHTAGSMSSSLFGSRINNKRSITNDSGPTATATHQIYDVIQDVKYEDDEDQLGSLIEEEMTFEELSSKLGPLHNGAFPYDDNFAAAEGAADQDELRRHHQQFNTIGVNSDGMPFNDLPSSACISLATPLDSFCQEEGATTVKGGKDGGLNKSVDFMNLPALLGPLEGKKEGEYLRSARSLFDQAAQGSGQKTNQQAPGARRNMRPRFDYESRLFNHFNVNKMTFENQAFTAINRGSFADNLAVGDKRQDMTGDSENISPIAPKLNSLYNSQNIHSAPLSPLKALESQTLLKGLETPHELSELYEDFDIYHEAPQPGDEPDLVSQQDTKVFDNEGALGSQDTQRTLSDQGTGRALIPETGIQRKSVHLRQLTETEFATSGAGGEPAPGGKPSKKYPRMRTFDLSREGTSIKVGERLVQILDLAAAGSIIKLPAQEIEISTTVTIRQPFRIVGQPGTCLYFKASTLIFDLNSEQKDGSDQFRYLEPVIFSQVQFQFHIDLKAVAYSKYQRNQRGSNMHTQGGLVGSSAGFQLESSKGLKVSAPPMHHHHQSRTLVQLIQVKNGSKAEFRDCSFRCHKVFHYSQQPSERKRKTQSSLNGAPNAGSNLAVGSAPGGGQQQTASALRARTDGSNSINTRRQTQQNTDAIQNASSNRHDSISAGPSEKQLNDSASLVNQGANGGANTSGRILGRYFANEKEEEQVLRENVHEVCFWMNAEAMNEHPSCLHEFSKNSNRYQSNRERKKPYKGSLLLQSCVFTGFYNQVRAGCNATIEIDKCYMQESMSSALMLVNPCYLRMVESNLIRTQINSGVNIRWLSDSINKNFSRVIDIQQNDFGQNYYCGIEIQGNSYSAHNLKIDISRNCIYRNKREGLLISNLALSGILLYANELNKNEGDNLKISQVHHKSNRRYAFRAENCQIENSKGGFGGNFFDTSFVVKNCIVKGNQSGGLFLGCPEKPAELVQDAIFFLKKFPMSIKLSNCEVTQNMHYGVLVQDFWKGSVIFKHTLVQYNCNFGVYIHAKEPPKNQLVAHTDPKALQRSLNNLMLSAEKQPAEETSIMKMFNRLNPMQRRQTLPISPSAGGAPTNNAFNNSLQQNSQNTQTHHAGIGLTKRKQQQSSTKHPGLAKNIQRAQSMNTHTFKGFGQDKNDSNSFQLLTLKRIKPPSNSASKDNSARDLHRNKILVIDTDKTPKKRPSVIIGTDKSLKQRSSSKKSRLVGNPFATGNNADIEEESLGGGQQQTQGPITTMRNLITRDSADNLNTLPGMATVQSRVNVAPFGMTSSGQQNKGLYRTQSQQAADQILLSSVQERDSPAHKQQNTSIASSLIASLRRKTSKNTVDNSLLRVGRKQNRNVEESGQFEISRQLALQVLIQIDQKLVAEKQELGKVYLIEGSSITKNGGAGVAVRHCWLEIDAHPKSIVQDNDFGFQVYVMLKQCQRLLTGFEQAMIEHRIRGRKVLVGGGWGQVTPKLPERCCGGYFKPCMDFFRRCCLSKIGLGGSSGKQKGNKIVSSPMLLGGTQESMGRSATRGHVRRGTITEGNGGGESPDVARADTNAKLW